MKNPTILIIKTGSTYRDVRTAMGDFDVWIQNAVSCLDVAWKVKPVEHVEPDKVQTYDGVILTGAHLSLTRPYPYLEGMKRLVDNILKNQIPTLGICFGHQLINKILGGEVITNPLGIEMGIIKIQFTLHGLTDPLFEGLLPAKTEVYSSHNDIVSKLSSGVVPLAKSERTQYQATRYGKFIYTVQFHPEYNRGIMEMYLRREFDRIKADYLRNPLHSLPPQEILNLNRDLQKSRKILNNFITIVNESK